MKNTLSVEQIVELIDNLSSEDQKVLFNKIDQLRKIKKHPLLNIPPTLTDNPLLDEVTEHITNYRLENEQEIEAK